jgi:hypothetical protein
VRRKRKSAEKIAQEAAKEEKLLQEREQNTALDAVHSLSPSEQEEINESVLQELRTTDYLKYTWG